MSVPSHPKKIAILFSGGPAPGANAVITAAASAFRRSGSEVVGFLYGYSGLTEYDPETRPLVLDQDYMVFKDQDLQGLRGARGIHIGTSRANPGKKIRKPEDLKDPARTEPLLRVQRAMVALGVEA